jgi:hypothetical protein
MTFSGVFCTLWVPCNMFNRKRSSIFTLHELSSISHLHFCIYSCSPSIFPVVLQVSTAVTCTLLWHCHCRVELLRMHTLHPLYTHSMYKVLHRNSSATENQHHGPVCESKAVYVKVFKDVTHGTVAPGVRMPWAALARH